MAYHRAAKLGIQRGGFPRPLRDHCRIKPGISFHNEVGELKFATRFYARIKMDQPLAQKECDDDTGFLGTHNDARTVGNKQKIGPFDRFGKITTGMERCAQLFNIVSLPASQRLDIGVRGFSQLSL